MKRIVSLILALSMVLSMFTMSFAGSSLKDVEGTKYQAAVEALIELGVVSGYPDGTYLPDNVVTRAELAKLLVVAYGLEPAAEASKGVTPFADVNAVANHWASGYINVSADYKFVNGYPDGSFKGDATVTYAEAITMCLRVLGYANEIDAKGTWPTNYIAKAQDLKLMKDIEFKSYNDGAKRGDIALLIWNMLRTPMWEVTGETEGDGLASAPNRYMLNVKFSDYAYTDKATFEGFEIKEDKKEDVAKVYVTLANGRDAQENTNSYDVFKDGEYEYAGNDFYQFVPGTEVEVLVNKEDKTLLTMVVTGSDKLVEGNRDAINDKYELSGDFDYAYARIESKKVKASTTLTGETYTYVHKFENKSDYVKINGTRENKDDHTGDLYLRNGERIEISDIKVGDIITEVTVSNGETFYVIGATEAEGKLTKVSEEEYENVADTYLQATIAGEEYLLASGARYVEDPEKDAEKAGLALTESAWKTGMKNEEVVAKLDPMFGKIVRLEFDGHIGDSEDTTYRFFAATSEVYTGKTAKEYYIDLTTVDGDSDEYKFAKSALEKARTLYNAANLEGRFVAVELNDDDEVVDVKIVAQERRIDYGTETNEYYAIHTLDLGRYDKDEKALIENHDSYPVTNNVIVAIEKIINEGKKNEEKVVEFSEGVSELEGLKNKSMSVVIDMGADIQTAKFVVLSDVEKTSDNKVAKVKSVSENKIGEYEIELETEDGSKETAIIKQDSGDATKHSKGVVVYTTETNKDDELVFNFVTGLTYGELDDTNTNHGYVSAVDGTIFTVKNGGAGTYNLASKTVRDLYEDATIVIVEVTEVKDEDNQYEVDTITTVEYDELTLEVADRISVGLDEDDEVAAIFVIRNMPEMD